MSAFDIFILVVAVASLVWGFAAGFMRQLGTLAGLLLAVVACRIYGADVSLWLARIQGDAMASTGTVVMAYIGLFLIVFLASKLVANLLRTIIHTLCLGIVDRLAGAVLKAVICMFVVSVGLNFWTLLAPDSVPDGVTARHVEQFAPQLVGLAASTVSDNTNLNEINALDCNK